jgi:hypothetical protein
MALYAVEIVELIEGVIIVLVMRLVDDLRVIFLSIPMVLTVKLIDLVGF